MKNKNSLIFEKRRISELERKLRFLDSNLKMMELSDVYYPKLKMQRDEYALEYWERTGRDYFL